MAVILISLAVLAFFLVAFEDLIHINKAKSVLFIGTLSWILVYIFPLNGLDTEHVSERLDENLLEIATLWLFLMSAMTFVAYLNSQGLVSSLVQGMLPDRLHERTLMLMLGGFAFLFSSFADNVTATLVSIAVISSIDVPAKKRLRYATLTIFAVNSGGVSLITGDVTTLMIFLDGKVTILNLLLLVLPSFSAVALLAIMLSVSLRGEVQLEKKKQRPSKVDWVIAAIFLVTIFSTLVLNILFHIPPVLTFLFGLSVMFLVAQQLLKKHSGRSILNYIREIEFDTLLFFLGVLLIIGLLKEIGVLRQLTALYELLPSSWANYVLGMASALLDNVPLTAAVLKADIEMSSAEWLSLTYATGVGGSLLIIGSAAGIIAMSKVREVTFISYLRMFFFLLIAYSFGYWFSYWIGHQFLP